MAFIRYKQIGSNKYAYQVTSIWDKENKKTKKKSVYLGRLNEESKKIIPPREEKHILDFGNTHAVYRVIEKSGFLSLLTDCFGKKCDTILALICYQIFEGLAMCHATHWLQSNIALHLFKTAKLSTQAISRTFAYLATEDVKDKFFKSYVDKFFLEKPGLLIDTTALPNSIRTDMTAWGYGGGHIAKQVSCLMLVEDKSKMPIYFRCVPGNIPDVSTLRVTLEEIKSLRLNPESVILDAGFFSEENIKLLFSYNIPFVTRLPKRKLFSQLIEDAGNFETGKYVVLYGKRAVFIKQQVVKLYGSEVYAYLILDPEKKGRDTTKLLRNSSNIEAIQHEEIAKQGFFAIISSKPLEPKKVLPTYYRRAMIEQIFGFCKANNNILPLRRHSRKTMEGFIFLSFLTLIVYITLREALIGRFTVSEAVLILRALKCRIYENQEMVVLEPTKLQKEIFKQLDILVPKKAGI